MTRTQPHGSRGIAAPAAITAAIAALAFLAVFALPWFAPIQVRPVVSESQAAGFDNRVAIAGLAVCALAIAALGMRAARGSEDTPAFVAPAGADNAPVNRWLLAAFAIASVIWVAALAWVYRDHPYSDALYFVDRMLYALGGEAPYTRFEFTYGPLMLYIPLAIDALLKPFGGQPHHAYYTFVALADIAGLLLLAYVLRRLHARDSLRNALFALVAAYALLQLPLWANYTLLRFMLPYAAFLWALETFTDSRWRPSLRIAMAAAAPVAASLFSLEMGIATILALLAALTVLAFRRRGERATILGAAGGLVGVAIVIAVTITSTTGMVGAFAGGAFQMPALPGPLMLAYVASMLVLAWGVGRALSAHEPGAAAACVGWFVIALVLSAPALSRADVIHLFFNGIGAFAGAAAVLGLKRKRTPAAYVSGLALIAAVGLAYFQASAMLPGALASGVRAGTVPLERAKEIATYIGDPKIGTRYDEAAIPDVKPEQVRALAARGRVAVLAPIEGTLGRELSEERALVPTYVWQLFAVTVPMAERVTGQAADADFLVMPRSIYEAYSAHPLSDQLTPGEPPMIEPPIIRSTLNNAQFSLFPIALRSRHPILDSQAIVAAEVRTHWVFDGDLGPYVVLRASDR